MRFRYLVGQENLPVVGISCLDALAYSKSLSREAGLEARLARTSVQ